MKIQKISHNNRKKGFEVQTTRKTWWFPYAKLDLRPSASNKIVQVIVDKELGHEGFTYRLESGSEGTVHMDQVLEYNHDPTYVRELILYTLTLEVQKRVCASLLSKREIIRRLGTSAAQFYRLLDPTNYKKSLDQLLVLLHVLECEVDFVVRGKTA